MRDHGARRANTGFIPRAPSEPPSLEDLGDSLLAYKIWDGDSYEWSGVAPTDGFTNVLFTGPDDPATSPGGRDVEGDVWIER